MTSCTHLKDDAFLSKRSRFNISLFDATFAAVCGEVFPKRKLLDEKIDPDKLSELQRDEEFIKASQADTARAGPFWGYFQNQPFVSLMSLLEALAAIDRRRYAALTHGRG